MTTAPEGTQRTDIGVGWGVRASFIQYVTKTGGTVTPFRGAGLIPGGLCYFPVVDLGLNPDSGATLVRGVGGVAFEAHGGALQIQIIDPELRIGPDGGAISFEAMEGGKRLGRVDVVTVAWGEPEDDGTVTMWRERPTVLTPDGSVLFMNYEVGTPFEPITLRVPSEWLRTAP